MTDDPLSPGKRLMLTVGLAALSLLAEAAERLDQRDRRNHREHCDHRPRRAAPRTACTPLLLAAVATIGGLALRGHRGAATNERVTVRA